MNAKELLAEWERDCILPDLPTEMKVSARLGFLAGLVASPTASNPVETANEAMQMILEMSKVVDSQSN